MADVNDFLVELMTTLNTTQAISDVKQLENELKKRKINLQTVLNMSGNERIIQEYAVKIQNIFKEKGIDIDTSKIVSSLNQVSKQAETVANKISNIKFSIDNGHGVSEYQNRIDKIINDFEKYGVASDKAQSETKELQRLLSEMKGMPDDKLVAQGNKIEQEFKAVKVSFEQAKLSYDKLLQPITSTQQINLTNKIEKWLANNTKATKTAREQLKLYLKELQGGQITKNKYIEINNELTNLDTEMRNAGKLGKSLFQSLSDGAQKFTSWISATAIVMKTINATRQAVTAVNELDTALVDLKKTAKMSASELNNFYYSANDTAKQMGVTTQEIIEQASAWSRLGFSTADAATKMAKYSSMFKTISPGMDLDSATNGLVSVMKAFKIGLEDTDDVVDGIMSKINIIGNTQAVDNSDIVDFLTRSSSAMAEANNTLEDTIALGTAATEITRDAASVGNALKTISMRIRGYDEETEEYIGGVEQLSGEIANLTKTASTPGGISLFTDDAKTEFKSTKKLFDEIAEIYNELTDKDQAQLLEALAGKRQGQIVGSILNNYETVSKSIDSMANSAGNAEAEMNIAIDSIDYKLNQLKETGTGIAQNLFEREDMKALLDMLTKLAEAFDFVTDKAGLLGTISLGAGLFAGIKNVGRDKMFSLICFEYADNNMCSLGY